MRSGREPSQEQLDAAWPHLAYEAWMLLATGRCYQAMPRPEEDNGEAVVLHNAVLESFLLHFRQLYDFLYGRVPPKHADDVMAAHYVGPAWSAKPEQRLTELDGRADQQLAHLTYKRQLLKEQLWDVPYILEQVLGALQRFRDSVASNGGERGGARDESAGPHAGGSGAPPRVSTSSASVTLSGTVGGLQAVLERWRGPTDARRQL